MSKYSKARDLTRGLTRGPATRPRGSALATIDTAPARDELMALAGLDVAEQARLLKASVWKMEQSLEREKIQRLVIPGGHGVPATVEEFKDADGSLQLKAASELVSLLGAYPSKQGHAPSASPQTIVVVFAQRPPAVEVIDVESKPL